MDENRLTKMTFNTLYNRPSVGTWCYYVKNILRQLDMLDVFVEKKECNLQLCKEKLQAADTESVLKEVKSQS